MGSSMSFTSLLRLQFPRTTALLADGQFAVVAGLCVGAFAFWAG